MRPSQRHVLPSETNSAKERFHGDLMFKAVVFVYATTVTKDALGSGTDVWDTKPLPINASVQFQGTNSQQTDPKGRPARYAHIFTRVQNAVKWHDKLVVKGISLLTEKVENKYANGDGSFQYVEIRASLIDEKDSIQGADATFKKGTN